jgi:hypothetical protein
MSRKLAAAKAGPLHRFDERLGGGTWVPVFASLRGHELFFSVSEGDEARETHDVEDAVVSAPEAARAVRRFSLDVVTRAGVRLQLATDAKEEHESWLQACAAAAVPDAWPGGLGANKRPSPLLYSMWAVEHAGSVASVLGTPAAGRRAAGSAGAGGSGASGSAAAAAAVAAALEARVPSPFSRLPLLKSVPAWQRKGLFLQKLRQCSIVFDGVDPSRFLEDREVKRNTLLEIVDFVEAVGRTIFQDARILDDTFTVVRLNIFRPLASAPPMNADPDEGEEAFSDPLWPHLSIVYELLLRLVSSEHVDLASKKRVIDAGFVRALLSLFDSEDLRERDYLKTITHRIYSKITQRRALIRRVICAVFHDFILETGAHNGIAEMLEILASIINGFAVPVKDEHKKMLASALLPLHKARAIATYHPQLSYCMALFAAKDHVLTRDILIGILKYWPFGSAAKQIMFLNELEDIFEYVLVSCIYGKEAWKVLWCGEFCLPPPTHLPTKPPHPTGGRYGSNPCAPCIASCKVYWWSSFSSR